MIIASLTIVSVDPQGDLECLYKACQAAKTDEGLFEDTGVDERGLNGIEPNCRCTPIVQIGTTNSSEAFFNVLRTRLAEISHAISL